MISGASITGLQRAFSSLLLFLMLLVSNAPFLNALASLQADCSTNCCRSKKSCCCKKAKPSHDKPTSSISARTCPSGCGQFVAVTSVLLALASGGFASTTNIPAVLLLGAFLLLTPVAATLCFALFQRPPPYSLLLGS
jgi:hypothetical protein